jgi:hypothetical protein
MQGRIRGPDDGMIELDHRSVRIADPAKISALAPVEHREII